MTYRIIASALCLLPAALFAQYHFTINGTLKNMVAENEKIYIMYDSGEKAIRDSAVVKNGRYTFKGDIPEPVMCQLNLGTVIPAALGVSGTEPARTSIQVYLSKGTISVVSDRLFDKRTVSGSPAQLEYDRLQQLLQPYEKGMDAFRKEYDHDPRSRDVANKDKINHIVDSLWQLRKRIYKNYILKHPNSPIAAKMLQEYVGNVIKDLEEADQLLQSLSPAVKNYPTAKSLRSTVDAEKKLGTGKPAIEFAQADTSGQEVKLSSFRGKYVLLDFWASWCGPCRRENPNLVAAFNKYHDKGFTVLSVALDNPGQKDRWMDAIHKDQLTQWTHVSDLGGWNNAAARAYGINLVPQNFLINPEGIIVGRNLHGETLNEKLAIIFNK